MNEEDVLRLDVAMDDPLGMGGFERVDDGLERLDDLVSRHPLAGRLDVGEVTGEILTP
jgi:hypothetical protein